MNNANLHRKHRLDLVSLAGALRKAQSISGDENDLVVGVCDGAGDVRGVARLRCYRQVVAFTRELAKLGYRAHIQDSTQAMQGCDLLYVPSH